MMGLNDQIAWVRQPAAARLGGKLAEVWHARALILFFGRQALLKTVRRTVLGWLWLPLRGLVPTLVGSLVMGSFLGVQSPHAPYPLFLLAGIIPWLAFALTASWSVRCLELSGRYLRASAFPRLVLPLGFVAPALLDVLMFAATYLVLIVWYAAHGIHFLVPDWSCVGALLLAFISGLGWGMLLSVPGARARDVRFTLGFVLSGLFALTPIAYPLSMVPANWQWLVSINPLAAIVEGFRGGLLGYAELSVLGWTLALCFGLLSLIAGLYMFNRSEPHLNDNI